jgi:arsenate reductase-like glutaredoxin family protein
MSIYSYSNKPVLRRPIELGYIDSIGVIDEHLGGYLGRMKVFDAGDDLEEADKETLAQQVLAAQEAVPDPATRVSLVVSLKLDNYLPTSSVPSEAGPLIGLLIEHEVIEDNTQSFGLTLAHGWATKEVAISKSESFATFMAPTEVPISDVPQLLRSSDVSSAVKDELIGRFEEFIPSDDREAVKAAAEYAAVTKKKLTFQQLQRVIDADVGQDLATEVLSLTMTGLSLDELKSLLVMIGDGFKALTSKNGKRPKIRNTGANLSILEWLKSLGQVSSFKQKGDDIEVNLKKS